MPNRYHIATMGCQMNERDSETIAGVLEGLGLVASDRPDDARVAVLNTCAVREKPEHKVFSRLGELAQFKQRRPNMIIAVCGCMAQVGVNEIRKRAPYVDIILGPRNLKALGEAVRQALTAPCLTVATDVSECPDESLPVTRTPGLSAFVNITYGCDNFCSYCIVPYTRGREISRPVEEILAEVRGLIADGYREITLLGQNVNSYKAGDGEQETGNSAGFAELLRLVGQVENLWRLRFTTSHPKDLSEEVLQAIAETPAVCEHLHLPLQSGDNVVLQRMGRHYSYRAYKALVDRARELVPGLSLTTDVMAGFPGETDRHFENTMKAFEEIRFDQAFMFKYSDRTGTKASKMHNKVDDKLKQQRLQRLVDLQNQTSREINQAQTGQVFEVLVEGRDAKSPEKMRGRTRQNKLMIFPGGDNLIGKLVTVRAEDAYLWGFLGIAQ